MIDFHVSFIVFFMDNKCTVLWLGENLFKPTNRVRMHRALHLGRHGFTAVSHEPRYCHDQRISHKIFMVPLN